MVSLLTPFRKMRMPVGITLFLPLLLVSSLPLVADDFRMHLRSKIVPEPVVQQDVRSWNPTETAIIVCDMWDAHWCKGATARVVEMAPTMNKVLTIARNRGVTIFHAPSDTMDFYADSPARKRIQTGYDDPEVRRILGGERWNNGLPSEEFVKWPVDQSDGGCDCEPQCPHPPYPWKSQIATLVIDEEKDLISDSGVAIASYMKAKGITNVILMGVHTNMCVIGRPFGLRNQVKLGNNVVLMRDLTDTMYNSRSWPHVSHFEGTRRVIDHIEKYVCPTIVSTDFTGEPSFRFKGDDTENPKPVITVLVCEEGDEIHYLAYKNLPPLMNELGSQNNWEVITLSSATFADFPSVEVLDRTDVLVLYVRRIGLPKEQMQRVKQYVNESGKGLVALRTASHGFAPVRLPDGCDDWKEFDQVVLGGNYQGHTGNDGSGSEITNVNELEGSPILRAVKPSAWHSQSWTYNTSPVAADATVYQYSAPPGKDKMPLTWTRMYGNTRVAYTALGHQADFEVSAFKALLRNLVHWAAEKE